MFSGTVRLNLDPFEEYQDEALWEVLEAVGLKAVIVGFEAKLDAGVVDGGNNFSQVSSRSIGLPTFRPDPPPSGRNVNRQPLICFSCFSKRHRLRIPKHGYFLHSCVITAPCFVGSSK